MLCYLPDAINEGCYDEQLFSEDEIAILRRHEYYAHKGRVNHVRVFLQTLLTLIHDMNTFDERDFKPWYDQELLDSPWSLPRIIKVRHAISGETVVCTSDNQDVDHLLRAWICIVHGYFPRTYNFYHKLVLRKIYKKNKKKTPQMIANADNYFFRSLVTSKRLQLNEE